VTIIRTTTPRKLRKNMSKSVNADVDAFAAEAEAVSNVTPVTGVETTPEVKDTTQRFYTEEDLAKVRSQEKDKLYPQIEKLKEELDLIKKESASRSAVEAEREAALEAQKAEEAKRKQEEELEVRDLLKVKEQEWADQLELERQERERAFALLEREKTFAELQGYRNQRVEQERDNIVPELIDMVTGDTVEEIESSIQGLKAKSSSILESVQQAMQAARRDMTGTRVTTPPNAGPLDIEAGNKQLSAADIANMPMHEYAKLRNQILSPAAQGKSTGLLG